MKIVTRFALRLLVALLLLSVTMMANPAPLLCEMMATADTEPPQLISFDVQPRVVNNSLGDHVMYATIHVTDDLSGMPVGSVALAYCAFESPSGKQGIYFEGQWSLIAGDMRDGAYRCPATIFQYQEVGTWRLKYLSMYDRVGNGLILSRDDVKSLGFPTEILVTDTLWVAYVPIVH